MLWTCHPDCPNNTSCYCNKRLLFASSWHRDTDRVFVVYHMRYPNQAQKHEYRILSYGLKLRLADVSTRTCRFGVAMFENM